MFFFFVKLEIVKIWVYECVCRDNWILFVSFFSKWFFLIFFFSSLFGTTYCAIPTLQSENCHRTVKILCFSKYLSKIKIKIEVSYKKSWTEWFNTKKVTFFFKSMMEFKKKTEMFSSWKYRWNPLEKIK